MFEFNSECNWVAIKLLPKPIQEIDTLRINFKLSPFNYTDTSQYSVQFEDAIYYYPDSLFGDIGLKILVPHMHNHLEDSVVISLENVDWYNEDIVELYFNSNLPTGPAGWQPVDIGNIGSMKQVNQIMIAL